MCDAFSITTSSNNLIKTLNEIKVWPLIAEYCSSMSLLVSQLISFELKCPQLLVIHLFFQCIFQIPFYLEGIMVKSTPVITC